LQLLVHYIATRFNCYYVISTSVFPGKGIVTATPH